MANKAGYTAISCGRVGRSGNARFPTFQLDDPGRTNGPTDQRTDGWTDKASYRVACPQLKTNCETITVRYSYYETVMVTLKRFSVISPSGCLKKPKLNPPRQKFFFFFYANMLSNEPLRNFQINWGTIFMVIFHRCV